MAGAGRDVADQRPAHRPLSPLGSAAQSGQAAGHGASAAIDLTRSLAQEVQSFDSNLTQQLLSEQQILELMGTIQDVSDPAAEPKVTRLLENFVESNHTTVLYITAVSTNKKG